MTREEKKIIAYKGFDENLCCNGFQYKVGEEYEHKGEIICCENGFHACTNPLDLLVHYPANMHNRFCEVEQYGTIDHSGSIQASSKIKIKREIGIDGLFRAAVEWWINEETNPSRIVEENLSNDFYEDSAKISSSGRGSQIGSSGKHVKITLCGNPAKICSTEEDSVICCSGETPIVKAKKGSWITLSERLYSEEKKQNIPVCVKIEFVDGERIKEDAWYKLIDGEFVEQK